MSTLQKASSSYPSRNAGEAPQTLQETVFIVDDDQKTRKSLRWLVESFGIRVESFSSAEAFLEACDPERSGCLVVDVQMAGMNGLDLQEELLRRGQEMPVIILTGYGDIPRARRAIKNGALDFLEKPLKDCVLLESIRRGLALDASRRRKRDELKLTRDRMARLTLREREVMRLVVEGLASKEIARRLDVCVKTVEAHRAKVMRKMEAECIAQLVRNVVSTISPFDGVPSAHPNECRNAHPEFERRWTKTTTSGC